MIDALQEPPNSDESSQYFVMTSEGEPPVAAVRLESDWWGGPWMTGELLTEDDEVPDPVVFSVDPAYPGNLKPLYQKTITLMRDDLVDALAAAGVDNLQIFDARVRDNGRVEHTNFKAINIIGVVSAADMSRSEIVDTSDSNLIDVDFESLVLDERRAGGLRLFRLAESVNAIVVHRSVRDIVQARVPEMIFHGAGEWSG